MSTSDGVSKIDLNSIFFALEGVSPAPRSIVSNIDSHSNILVYDEEGGTAYSNNTSTLISSVEQTIDAKSIKGF